MALIDPVTWNTETWFLQQLISSSRNATYLWFRLTSITITRWTHIPDLRLIELFLRSVSGQHRTSLSLARIIQERTTTLATTTKNLSQARVPWEGSSCRETKRVILNPMEGDTKELYRDIRSLARAGLPRWVAITLYWLSPALVRIEYRSLPASLV